MPSLLFASPPIVKMSAGIKSRSIFPALFILCLALLFSSQPARCDAQHPAVTTCGAPPAASLSGMAAYSNEDCMRLNAGEVVVDLTEEDSTKTKFVAARILIDETPENVWQVLVNPFEFERKITPRMKSVQVLADEEKFSILSCTMDVCFLFPPITYTVASTYEPLKEVRFKRIGGTLRDFRGRWALIPVTEKKTVVLYSMFVDPGIPIPRWLVREGVKMELPRTLQALRERIYALRARPESAEPRAILAVGTRPGSGVAVTGASP